MITDNDSKFYQDPGGQIYITVGTGGAVLYGFSASRNSSPDRTRDLDF